MKVIGVSVARDVYDKLKNGSQLLDVRVNVPEHDIGDIIVYTLFEDGNLVYDENVAFLIESTNSLDDFAERIGEQLILKDVSDTDELVVVTLKMIPGQGK